MQLELREKEDAELRQKEVHPYTVEPLLRDTLNKGHNTFNLSVKDKFRGSYHLRL